MKPVRPSPPPLGKAVAFVILAASLILAACGKAATPVSSPLPPASPSATLSTLTRTPLPTSPSTSTPTPLPPTATSTATPIPCDPSGTDYCLENGYFIFQPPISPPGTDGIDRGYPFGSTEGGTREPHHGVEFYNASGTPVLAAAGGTVYYAGDDTTRKFSPWSGFYGNIVVLQHPLSGAPFEILYTLYAHLSKLDVTSGQSVLAGEKIGEVGLTGTASGSHLHFEVRVDPNDYSSALNPELWLIPHPGNGTLALLTTDQTGARIFPTFNVQYYPDRTKPEAEHFQVDAYALETVNPRDPWGEIAALGDQPAGSYRVTFQWAGVLYEKWVDIQPGKLTRVMFVVK